MGAVYEPDIVVQCGFGYGPLDASPVWTTVSSYGHEITTRRGRGSEFDQFTPGSCTVVLKDETRRFDPLNTAGPYYGQLVPNVPIRIYATHSTVDYPIFYGYVDGWDYQLSGANNVGWVTVNATDGFKLLARKRLPDPFRDTVEAFSPVAWWRFDNTDGLIATDDIGDKVLSSTAAGGLTPVTAWAQVDGLTDKSVAAVQFPAYTAASAPTYVNAALPDGVGVDLFPSTAWSVSMWVNITAPPTADTMRVLYASDTTGDYVTLIVLSTGVLRFAAGSADAIADSPTNLCDGVTHHIVMVRDGTTVTLYVDGLAVATDTEAGFTGTFGTINSFRIGEVTTAGADIPAWTLDDLVFIPSTLTAADVQTIREAYLSLYGGTVQTGERHGDILDLVGWPAGLRDIDTGELTVGPQDVAGKSALSTLQTLDATEQGRTFMAADGAYTVDDAQTMSADTAASVVFSDDGSDVGYLSRSFRMSLDARNIYNEAQVTREGGLMQSASDSASVAAYGPLTRSLSGLVMLSDSLARNLAERIVARYKDPQTRVEAWTVNPQYKTSTWASVLGVEIGDHVQLEVRPLNTGTREVIDLDVEQIVTTITPAAFEFTFIGSARDPNIGAYFTWGGDGATQGWGVGVWR